MEHNEKQVGYHTRDAVTHIMAYDLKEVCREHDNDEECPAVLIFEGCFLLDRDIQHFCK